MRTLNAIILAAGEGTRMKSERPKVLHTICGRPMISYALDLATATGAKQPIVILGHGADQVKPVLPKEARVVIQAKQLGTGDAVIAAKRTLGSVGDVLILYADTPLLRRTTVQKLVESHFKTSATCTLLTAHLADPSGYGRIVRNETGQIIGIIEDGEANASQRAIREINIGALACKVPALVEALAVITPSPHKRELYLTEVISHIARQEGTKIQATRVEEVSEALGVNSRTELARAIGVIRQRIVDAHLHNGVTIEDPQTAFIDHGVTIGADTIIHPYTVIETGVSIGRRCSIGPFARLRTGTAIADDVRVGNFAELVRTKVSSHVRINHVSYLGDATIEESVNIGAGSITANFDGTEKHPTQIGKGAFIGCDTVLIAPVNIGQKAVTGAGAVIPRGHDVPAKGVVVGVPARPLGLSGVDHGVGARHKSLDGSPKSTASPPRTSTATRRVRPAARPSRAINHRTARRSGRSTRARLHKSRR